MKEKTSKVPSTKVVGRHNEQPATGWPALFSANYLYTVLPACAKQGTKKIKVKAATRLGHHIVILNLCFPLALFLIALME